MIKNLLTSILIATSYTGSILSIEKASPPNIKALPNVDDETPVLVGSQFSSVQITTGSPGGGSPVGARYILYAFDISYTNLNYLQEFDKLFISLPYEAEKNNLTDLKMSLKNLDNTNVYIDIDWHSLSVAMLFNFGMTLPDNPLFMGKNFLDTDLMDNYKGNLIKVLIQIPINYFPPQWLEHTKEKTNFYSSLPNNDYAYQNGYVNGSIDGYNEGKEDGLRIGEDIGYSKGLLEADSEGVWGLVFNALMLPFTLLSIELFPGVTIGMIALIPLVFGVLAFIFKIGGKK